MVAGLEDTGRTTECPELLNNEATPERDPSSLYFIRFAKCGLQDASARDKETTDPFVFTLQEAGNADC